MKQLPPRRCRTCREVKLADGYSGATARTCFACKAKMVGGACVVCGSLTGYDVDRRRAHMYCKAVDCQRARIAASGAIAYAKARRRRQVRKAKKCGCCQQRKPLGDFYVHARDGDGSPKRVDAYCIKCRKAYERDRYRTTPRLRIAAGERAARQAAATRERMGRDPEFAEETRAKRREWDRAKRLRREAPKGDQCAPNSTPLPGRDLIPVAPLLAEIDRWVETRGRGALIELAQSTGVDDRALRRLREQETVTLDLADRLLVAMGSHLSLVYDFDDESAAA